MKIVIFKNVLFPHKEVDHFGLFDGDILVDDY